MTQLVVIFLVGGLLSGFAQAAPDPVRPLVSSARATVDGADSAASVPLAVLSYVRMTLQRHPELLLSEAQSRGAESQAREAQAQRAPKLVLSGNAGFDRQKINAASLTNSYE